MSLTKLNLKKVKYLRSHDHEHRHPIVLGGHSRWLRDIELLLEDRWKNLYCPEDFQDFGKLITEHPPRILVSEWGAYQSDETKLFDMIDQKGTKKILVAHSIQDAVAWKRIQRSMAGRGVSCIELSEDAKVASQEIDSIFSGLCASGFSLNEDLQFIQNAYHGYRIAQNVESSNLLTIFKTIASNFVFDPNDIVTGTLLVETFSLWKKPKNVGSSLHLAFMSAESSVNDENIFKIIAFSQKCEAVFDANGELDEPTFQQLAADSGFGRLTYRMIKGSFSEVAACLAMHQVGLRLVS